MRIPRYPDFVPLTLDLKEEMHPRLSLTADGVSEFTFAGLFLFRDRYRYRVSRSGAGGALVVSGVQPAKDGGGAESSFFMTPCEAPERAVLEDLFATHGFWKNVPDAVLDSSRRDLEEWGVSVRENRDNFDYLYVRGDLADLAGKRFHKKRNLVQQFENAYAGSVEEIPLSPASAPAAIEVLEEWRRDRGGSGDYGAAREALDGLGSLPLRGNVYLVGGKPAAYCLGESVAKGRMFAIHFEKALDRYKGIYQYVNRAFAAFLPRFFTHINREQDLGDEGLRQAKMTYRPVGFVRKHDAFLLGRGAA